MDNPSSTNSVITYREFIHGNLGRTVGLRVFRNVRVSDVGGTDFNLVHCAKTGDLFFVQRGGFKLASRVIELGECTIDQANQVAEALWSSTQPTNRVVEMQRALQIVGDQLHSFVASSSVSLGH